jgi:uncharacterized protein (DUF2235 family)
MKRIVICCDGTWNVPDQDASGVPRATNVARIARAVATADRRGIRQLTYYGTGVGTSGTWLKRCIAGAIGAGLSDNLLDAYRFLMRTYEPGDELFLFGFSRGAYTVRSLAGMINNSGLLRREHSEELSRAFQLYCARTPAFHPRREECSLFRKTYAWSDRLPVKFIGVWDTVGALGNPLLLMWRPLSQKHRFHDTALSSTVENAFHAMAIDEQRGNFPATLWHRQVHSANQVLEQRWFVGVHSNVGGGYPSTGLSDIALDWIAGKARACDLEFGNIESNPNIMEAVQNSRCGVYRLIPRYHRPVMQRDTELGTTNETLDDSVLERYRKDSEYRPPNLKHYFGRFPDRLL